MDTDRVDAVLRSAVEEERLVGAVVAVVVDGTVEHRAAHGYADRELGIAMTPGSRFRLSSLTKPIVTAAVLRLVEQGVLDLTSPVTRWLPAFTPALPSGDRPEITLHHLMTHTGGLAYDFVQAPTDPYPALGVSNGFDRPGVSFAQELELIAAAPLVFAPGSAWLYSVGLDVAGAVVEAATSSSLPEVVAALVTTPLGMGDTSFTATPEGDDAQLRGGLVTPYADDPAGGSPVRMGEGHEVPLYPGLQPLVYSPARALDPSAFPSAGAGMNGTVDDVVRLLEAVRTGGDPVLSPATAAAMTSNRIGALRTDTPENGGATGFGYGGSVLLDPGRAGTPHSAGTWAWGGVWGHAWFVDPARALTVVLMTNTALEGMQGRVTTDLRDAVHAGLA